MSQPRSSCISFIDYMLVCVYFVGIHNKTRSTEAPRDMLIELKWNWNQFDFTNAKWEIFPYSFFIWQSKPIIKKHPLSSEVKHISRLFLWVNLSKYKEMYALAVVWDLKKKFVLSPLDRCIPFLCSSLTECLFESQERKCV